MTSKLIIQLINLTNSIKRNWDKQNVTNVHHKMKKFEMYISYGDNNVRLYLNVRENRRNKQSSNTGNIRHTRHKMKTSNKKSQQQFRKL